MEVKWKIGLDVGSQPWRVEATVEADGWSHVEGPKPMELMVVELDSQVLGAVGQEPAFLGVAAHEVREAQHPDVVVHEVQLLDVVVHEIQLLDVVHEVHGVQLRDVVGHGVHGWWRLSPL